MIASQTHKCFCKEWEGSKWNTWQRAKGHTTYERRSRKGMGGKLLEKAGSCINTTGGYDKRWRRGISETLEKLFRSRSRLSLSLCWLACLSVCLSLSRIYLSIGLKLGCLIIDCNLSPVDVNKDIYYIYVRLPRMGGIYRCPEGTRPAGRPNVPTSKSFLLSFVWTHTLDWRRRQKS